MSTPNYPGWGGPPTLGQRIEEAVELIEMELRHAITYVNDAVIPQVRKESISAMRSAADTLRSLADRFERQSSRATNQPYGQCAQRGEQPKQGAALLSAGKIQNRKVWAEAARRIAVWRGVILRKLPSAALAAAAFAGRERLPAQGTTGPCSSAGFAAGGRACACGVHLTGNSTGNHPCDAAAAGWSQRRRSCVCCDTPADSKRSWIRDVVHGTL